MADQDKSLTRSFEELMSGEDYAKLVGHIGGIDAAAKAFEISPEQVEAHMQEGKIFWVTESSPLDPEEVRAIMDQMGMNEDQFAEYIGIPTKSFRAMAGLDAGM